MEPNGVGMTEFMLSTISSKTLTLSEAVRQLKENAYMRTIKETLALYCGIGAKDEGALKKRVTELLLQSDPEAKRDSVERKVRTWMKDDAQAIGKRAAVQLAFALHLLVEDADHMLVRLSGERFHWRDPEDIIWVYGLNNRLSFPQANDLCQRLLGRAGAAQGREERTDAMTAMVKNRVMNLKTEDELAAFLEGARDELGKLHNTAYSLFMDFLSLLGLPDLNDFLAEAREMPIKEIVATYMYNNCIPRAHAAGKKAKEADASMQSAIQRDIRQNWPDEVVLSRMIHRETDVTRKVLILLFLACDGGESEYGDYSDDTPEDVFQDMYARMNSMLSDCGFAPLDSRTSFDWMVLYCMCTDESIFIDDTVQRFLSEIFPSGSGDGEET